MQNLACTYPIFMKHNPIFSQKCSDFSVFCPPTRFLRQDLRKIYRQIKNSRLWEPNKGFGGTQGNQLINIFG